MCFFKSLDLKYLFHLKGIDIPKHLNISTLFRRTNKPENRVMAQAKCDTCTPFTSQSLTN